MRAHVNDGLRWSEYPTPTYRWGLVIDAAGKWLINQWYSTRKAAKKAAELDHLTPATHCIARWGGGNRG